MAKNTTYTVVQGPLEHDGKSYATGEFIELDAKVGDPLADPSQGVLAKGKVDAPAADSEGAGEAQA